MPNHSLGSSTTVIDSESPVARVRVAKTTRDFTSRLTRSGLLAALIGAVLVWLVPIKSGLWFDETISYWQISSGFGPIWSRQGTSFPAYSYILWAWTRVFGTTEIALRIPSILAMLAAVFVLYRAARELFDFEIGLASCVLFSLHPIVIFAAIDARQYAFAVLTLNCAILMLLRWIRTHSTRHAVLLGLSSGLMFYFQYLFGTALLAFGLVLLATRAWKAPEFPRQFVSASAAFCFVMLPVFSRLVFLVNSRQDHVSEVAPLFKNVAETLAPGWIAGLFALAVLIAVSSHQLTQRRREPSIAVFACTFLAFVPLLVLYGTSTLTPTHVFVKRYLMVGMPGVALCWALLLNRIQSGLVRAGFCLALLALVAQQQIDVPIHGSDASAPIKAANSATSQDQAPVLVCSDLIESIYDPIPPDITSSSSFAPLSYYKLRSTVVPLPKVMNEAAEAQLNLFLNRAMPARQRFLVMAYPGSESIPRWLDAATKTAYSSRLLGTYSGVYLWEYRPR